MQYKLEIRPVNISDINAECPYMPEPTEHEMYLAAFIEDINYLKMVNNAEEFNGDIIVKLNDENRFEEFRLGLVTVHKEFFGKFRVSNITKFA
ncbi:hypothetical protein [Aliivibrio finisterrensis]|uniref:Uncharacterized protein n=1 Tax=Aliivibrio finisterrensis TaxID=511998 RepID=A0A6N6RNU9_9GAMM|nr:hypothetical protein [Aliivibrio finisterrensis]KAB2823139.1 hypothetical protein F8B77_16895 [Aliivibrio finisterrensis]